MQQLVVIKGAGDLASGIAHRLFRSGFRVIMTELPQPTVIRRTAAFAQAVFTGRVTVEGVEAARMEPADALAAVGRGRIAVVIDPEGLMVRQLKPWAVVDAILAKKNTGTSITDAPVVIGVGPGFSAGEDVQLVVETMRGHYLGRVIEAGSALPDTGEPGDIAGHTFARLLRAPCGGVFKAARAIADIVIAGDVVGHVGEAPVTAGISGVLRGLLYDGLTVKAGMKIGDIDPRSAPEHCFSISDKARAIGGGVLEGLLYRAGQIARQENGEGKTDR
jgi:xanthine dehydrogenase accessory factor